MRILQLVSDWKWTGPAEPMLLLLRALRERGHEVELACPEAPGDDADGADGATGLSLAAQEAGAKPSFGLTRGRGIRVSRDREDVRRLTAWLREARPDLVHTWHSRDHALALRARFALGRERARKRPAIVRSWCPAEPISGAPWQRWLFGPGSDGLLCASGAIAEAATAWRGSRPTASPLGAADSERFHAAAGMRSSAREELGLSAEDVAIGIAARVQRHRRFDLLFDAMDRLRRTHSAARLVVFGRGTHYDELAREPVARLGLEPVVCLAGYKGREYPEVLHALDLFTLLVPGSDGSCRALLEAAHCGLPAVTSRREPFPEIVAEGESGWLCDEHPEALAAAWARLLDDPEARLRLGEGARRRAARFFVPSRLAEEVEGFYEAVLGASSAPGSALKATSSR